MGRHLTHPSSHTHLFRTPSQPHFPFPPYSWRRIFQLHFISCHFSTNTLLSELIIRSSGIFWTPKSLPFSAISPLASRPFLFFSLSSPQLSCNFGDLPFPARHKFARLHRSNRQLSESLHPSSHELRVWLCNLPRDPLIIAPAGADWKRGHETHLSPFQGVSVSAFSTLYIVLLSALQLSSLVTDHQPPDQSPISSRPYQKRRRGGNSNRYPASHWSTGRLRRWGREKETTYVRGGTYPVCPLWRKWSYFASSSDNC